MATDTTSSHPPSEAADEHWAAPTVHDKRPHPTDLTYIKVGAVLFVITVGEVLTYTFGITGPVLLILLFPMMIAKFAIVAMFFMHLRFDSNLFTRVFVAGIVLAVGVYIIVLSTLHVFS